MMNTNETDLEPPSSVKGLKVIETELFKKTCCIPAIKIAAKHCSVCVKRLKGIILWRSRLKNVRALPNDNNQKIILCDPKHITSLNDLNNEQKEFLKQCDAELQTYTLELNYENFTMDQVLKAILTDTVGDIPTAFETIGHIAHLNLRECHEPFKGVIGRVILDKNSHIRTVVNKTSSIEETFRFFKMELLSGDDNMVATVKEHSCIFKFDFSKVYWNSRLQTEHHRITNSLKKEDIVIDVFAGVGPFAIPSGKKGCRVYANDLNEYSYDALKQNVIQNKVINNVSCFNLDGREFINLCFNFDHVERLKPSIGYIRPTNDIHVVMNLPAIAIDFLDVFSNLLKSNKFISHGRTVIHCYCFSKEIDPENDAICRVKKQFSAVELYKLSAYRVRDVAPQKTMICVTFMLPESNILADENDIGISKANVNKVDQEEPHAKIRRLNNEIKST